MSFTWNSRLKKVGAPLFQRFHVVFLARALHQPQPFIELEDHPRPDHFLDCQTCVCFTFVDIWPAVAAEPITRLEVVVQNLQLSSKLFAPFQLFIFSKYFHERLNNEICTKKSLNQVNFQIFIVHIFDRYMSQS